MEWTRLKFPTEGISNKDDRQTWYNENLPEKFSAEVNKNYAGSNDSVRDRIIFTGPGNQKFYTSFYRNDVYVSADNEYHKIDAAKLDKPNDLEVWSLSSDFGKTTMSGNDYDADLYIDTYTDINNTKHVRLGYTNPIGPCLGTSTGKCLNLETNTLEDFAFVWGRSANIYSTETGKIRGWAIFFEDGAYINNFVPGNSRESRYLNNSNYVVPLKGYLLQRYIYGGRVFPFYSITGNSKIEPFEEFIVDGKHWYTLPWGIVIPLSE